MVTIFLAGKAVSTSQNLRGIVRYSAHVALSVVRVDPLAKCEAHVYVEWANTARTTAHFASFTVAKQWATRFAARRGVIADVRPELCKVGGSVK
jgi:hypothetical protein